MLYSLKMRNVHIFKKIAHLLMSEIFDKKIRYKIKKVYDKYHFILYLYANFFYDFIIILFILINFMQFILIENRN